ncbi:MAG: LamG domain-containing protein [Saprospiraceae bacterium]|nr:LamG domain-containing protein [Candidatus Vicinibacter affinis]
MSKIFHITLALLLTIYTSKINAQCINRCLDFDGIDDHIIISNASLGNLFGTSSFAIELWFYTSNTCSPTSSRLLRLANNFYIDVCGTQLTMNYPGTIFTPTITYPRTISTNKWNCLSIKSNVNGSLISTFINGSSAGFHSVIPPPTLSGFTSTGLTIGNSTNSWLGKIDELKIWNINNLSNSSCFCPFNGNESNLVVYMPFDQGTPNENNSGITETTDKALLAGLNNGQIIGFAMNGPNSNFICSDAPIVYPEYFNLILAINDYLDPATPVTEICSGEPVHFCLTQNGITANDPSAWIPPIPNSIANVIWEYCDLPGMNWLPMAVPPDPNPSFKKFCFPVSPNTIVASCPNSDGYTDRKYRARIVVTNLIFMQQSCTYLSDEKQLRIYCALPPYSINVVSNPPLLCQGDTASLSFNLVPPAPSGTLVVWKNQNDDPFGTGNSVSLNNITVLSSDCIKCMIMNGTCPAVTLTKCITVDPIPTCGLIEALPTGTLTLIDNSPLTYEICPGNDASITFVSGTGPFANGIVTWQYMFPTIGNWNSLGVSNSIQNTNVLPCDHPVLSPYLWPINETCIVYRVQVKPFSDPSGCDTCYSNELKICLKPPLPTVTIYGADEMCVGETGQIAVTPFDPSWSINWYCNGVFFGQGKKITTDKTACYQAEISNGCQTTNTQVYCIQVCNILAKINCPLDPPNPYACPDRPIILSACDSKDLCNNPLTYSWSWDSGTLVSITGCMLEHKPITSGTNYSVTVTNNLGCSSVATMFVKPCTNP